MCGSFEQHLLSLKGALLGPLYSMDTFIRELAHGAEGPVISSLARESISALRKGSLFQHFVKGRKNLTTQKMSVRKLGKLSALLTIFL